MSGYLFLFSGGLARDNVNLGARFIGQSGEKRAGDQVTGQEKAPRFRRQRLDVLLARSQRIRRHEIDTIHGYGRSETNAFANSDRKAVGAIR